MRILTSDEKQKSSPSSYAAGADVEQMESLS